MKKLILIILAATALNCYADDPQTKLLNIQAQRAAQAKISLTGQERARASVEYQTIQRAIRDREDAKKKSQ